MKIDWTFEAKNLRKLARWRRKEAARIPGDPWPNLYIAECLERIANDLVNSETEDLRNRVEQLIGDDCSDSAMNGHY